MVDAPPHLIDEDAPLAWVLGAAARKLAKFYTAALRDSPVTPSQLFFLRPLWTQDGLTLADLRERAQLDATSATWLADQLEKAELIERRRNDPDRRVVRCWLTPAGQALGDDLIPEIARWERSFASVLRRHHSAAETEAFRRVLETLIRVLPEGEDLWAEIASSWEVALNALREYLESAEPE